MNVALASLSSTAAYSPGLLNPLFTSARFVGVDGLHADEYPFASRSRDEINEFFVAQQISADLRDPIHLRTGSDDVAQQRFRALDIDGEIIVDEEDRNLTAFAAAREPSAAATR